MISSMDRENWSTLMEILIEENLEMDKNVVKECMCIIMETNIRVNGWTMRRTEMVSINITQVLSFIKVSGEITKKLAMANTYSITVIDTLDNLLMVWSKETGWWSGPVEKYMMASGEKIKWMALVNILILKVKLKE